MIPPAFQAQMALRANLAKAAANNAPAAPAPTPEATIGKLPKEFPEQWLQRMKAQSAASDAVNASPFIDQKVGGAENIPSPAGAKVIKQALGSASALAKLNSDPEAEAEAKAQAKADAADVKAKAKAATVAAKASAGVPFMVTQAMKAQLHRVAQRPQPGCLSGT